MVHAASRRKPAVGAEELRQIEVVAAVLEGYSQRGVFRGVGRGEINRRGAVFHVGWRWNCRYELIFDFQRGALRCPELLANVPANSAMYRELKQFVRSRHADDLPEHRRVDPHKARVEVSNRGGNVSLVLWMEPGECEYGARKFVHMIQEIFLSFLADGSYFEYLVETFNLDPDAM
jgi:hypothetical protein